MIPTTLELIIGILGALTVSLIAWRMKALTVSGAVAAFIVGGCIFSFGGIEAAIILIAFFVSGSLLSKLNPHPSQKNGRDHKQVLSNGIAPVIGVLLTTLTPIVREQATIFFLASLATAAADTWATEIGMRYGNRVFNIFSFRPMLKGLSGGVSVIGLVASVLGAMFIAVLPLFPFWQGEKMCGLVLIKIFPVVVIAGFVGALIDSLLGATIQAKYEKDGLYIEENVIGSTRVSGISFVDNNVVNLISTIWGGLIGVALMGL
ncbi:MAG TPA: DUF92 domain-containing protein [Candidatus Kapabacteria bacterium]